MSRRLLVLLIVANSACAQFAGDIDEDGVATAIDVVSLANHLNASVPLSLDRLRLADVDQNAIIDAADLEALAAAVVGQHQLLPIGQAPTARAMVDATNQATVTISGNAAPNASVQVQGAANSANTTADTHGAYSLEVPLRPNQLNRLFISAGSATRTLQILHDDTPPRIVIESPGAETVLASVPVLGRLVDASAVTVQVDGSDAEVAHGSFAFDLALPLGSSTVSVVATDALGNQSTEPLSIERLVDDGSALQVISVNPPAVSVPFPNKLVTFAVTSGDGSVDGARIRQVFSDAFGVASVGSFEPGSEAGRGNHRLQVSSVDVPGVALFHASADPGPAVRLHADSGDRQLAEAGTPVPRPLRVWATDGRYGIPGVAVTFSSSHGHFSGANSATVVTDASGHAEITATLATEIGNQKFEANFTGNQLPPVTFVVEAMAPSQAGTSLRGIVLDTVHKPLPFATCQLTIGGSTLSTNSDIEGVFRFDNIAGSGYAELSISLFGYTRVAHNIVLVADADNRLPESIRLTRAIAQILFDNSADATLDIPDFGGFSFTFTAGSLADAPLPLSLDPVHADDLPVALPDGARAPLAWYLGPDYSLYDPPITFELPNITGLASGSAVHVLGYDASVGNFVVTGSGTVSDDGDRVISDPGSGISHGGFGAFCPPFPAHGTVTTCAIDCGQAVALVGGSIDTLSHAFVGEEVILGLQLPTDPGQEAVIHCGNDERLAVLAPQNVTARIDVYRDGFRLDSVTDSFVPDSPGSYTLEVVAQLLGPCPKNRSFSQQVEVVSEDCAVVTCLTPATVSDSPVPERASAVLPLGNGGVPLGFALRSPQILSGGEAEYSCDGLSFTRTRVTRAVPYTWEIRRRHDNAVIATGSGTVASASVSNSGCYYATFTGQPGDCVPAGTYVFETPETSVIDAALSLDNDIVCVGGELTGTLDISAPPCDGALSLSVTGPAEIVSSDDSSFTVRGTAPGVASIAILIDGAVFADASFTVFQLAFPSEFALGVGKEALIPVTVEPLSAASEFADFAIQLSIASGSGDARIRSGITLTSTLEVTLGGLAQGGLSVRALSAGNCQLQTPCADVDIQVIALGLVGNALCTGHSGNFSLASNIDAPVTLRLRTAFGSGSARFASGSDELQLSAGGDFVVNALSSSSDPENLLIEAFLASSDLPCASLRFTVVEFAFTADPLKVCVGNQQPVNYTVSPSGFDGDIALRSSDATKAVMSGDQVVGVGGSNSLDDTQLILSLSGVDCASRSLTVIEVTLTAEVKLCLGQTTTVTAVAKPDAATCSVTLALNQAGVTFPDGSRSRTVDLAALNSDGIDLLAGAPSSARNDSQLTAIGPDNQVCATSGLTVLDIGFSDPGSICIGVPGSVLIRAKPPLPDTHIDLVLSGPGSASFTGGLTSRSLTMAELDGQSLEIFGLVASNDCDDMAISASTAIGGSCASASFTVVDISFDAGNDIICVGNSRNIGISASPADPNCTVTLKLNDNSRSAFAGGVATIEKTLAELNSSGIDVTALAASAAANDVDLSIDVGGGNDCYHKALSMLQITFPPGELIFCSGQQATLAVTALPDVEGISVPIQTSGGLTVGGDATRTLASLNTDGLALGGSSGSVSIMVDGQACATTTPTVLELSFPAPDLKVCVNTSLNLAISANPALATVSATIHISDSNRATFADGSTEVTDTLASLASGLEILGVATSESAGDIAITLEVDGVICASATLTVFDIAFSLQSFEVCVGSTQNVGVTAVPSVVDCEVTLSAIGNGAATIDGQASRTYNLAELNLLGVSVQGTAPGSLVLTIDAGVGCNTVPFTVCNPE